MEVKTHGRASERLVGRALQVSEGKATTELETSEEMAVDTEGLIHGGFVFGLADYAAMLSVNHPLVVLGGSEVRFAAPVKVGDRMTAYASVTEVKGRRSDVTVEVKVGERVVFTGVMHCFTLEKHVLSR